MVNASEAIDPSVISKAETVLIGGVFRRELNSNTFATGDFLREGVELRPSFESLTGGSGSCSESHSVPVLDGGGGGGCCGSGSDIGLGISKMVP